MAKPTKLEVRAVLFESDDWWHAHCLEYDIVAVAKSLPELPQELWRVLISHHIVAEELAREPFQGMKPAPKKYWRMFDDAKLRVEGRELTFKAPGKQFPSINLALRVAELEHV